MKITRLSRIILLVLVILICKQGMCNSKSAAIEPFLGRWALYLSGGAGWLEVRDEGEYIDADLLWYGGSVVPVANVYLQNETLVVTRVSKVVRKKNNDGEPVRTHNITQLFKFKKISEKTLLGTSMMPKRNDIGMQKMEFTAKRIPDLPDRPDLSAIKYGKSISLFNGKNLSGWKLIGGGRENGFKVKDGALLNDPVQKEGEKHISYGNLRTVDTFEDFNLQLEVNIPKGNNSGIYLRGIYEVQVYDSYGKDLDSHNMGAVYSRITPKVQAEKPAGTWQSFDITLCERHITVILNGKTIIDNQPLLGVTGGALSADEFTPGPIYLQGDHGKVSYRNIVLKPILN